MAEEQAQEKTEQPSAKRIKEAREQGQVARSKDLNATLILFSSGLAFVFIGQSMGSYLLALMREALVFNGEDLILTQSMFNRAMLLGKLALGAACPILLIILFASIVAPLAMGGWIFSSEALQPKLSRLSLAKGMGRIFSLKSLVELGKALLKFILLMLISCGILYWQLAPLLKLAHFSLQPAIVDGLTRLAWSFAGISASLLLIAAIDVPLQWHAFQKELKMTKQELKDEFKETEGKPEVKSQIRRMQHELARKRMMSEVPKADVVLTNPTHYAVAMSYKQNGNRAPVVVAKGKDLIAFQINRIAQSHQIPQLSLPALTRAIYYSTELNEEIPRGLYIAVAQVLAYIFQLKHKTNYDPEPAILRDLEIPDHLKRDE